MAFLSVNKSLRLIKNTAFGVLRSQRNEVPLWVHFYVTRRCNLKCDYCYLYDNTTKDLSTQDVKKIIDKLYSVGIRVISFFGGEPTIRKDFCEILEYGVNKGIVAAFTTNGALLNKDYIDKIGKTGVYLIEVSLDSLFEFDESKKDFTRSGDILTQLFEGKKKYGFGVYSHLVITKKNLDHVTKTILLLTEHGIPVNVCFLNHNTYSDLPDDDSLFMKTEEDKKRFCETVDKIIELKRKNVMVFTTYDYLYRMKEYMNGDKDWNCSAGKYSFAVDYDGTIQLCYALPSFSGVNVLDDQFNKDFFKQPKIKEEIVKTQNRCMKLCFASCMYGMDNVIENPLGSIFPNRRPNR